MCCGVNVLTGVYTHISVNGMKLDVQVADVARSCLSLFLSICLFRLLCQVSDENAVKARDPQTAAMLLLMRCTLRVHGVCAVECSVPRS